MVELYENPLQYFWYSYPKLCYKHQLESIKGFAWYSNKFVMKMP